jgi:hypothetical protein
MRSRQEVLQLNGVDFTECGQLLGQFEKNIIEYFPALKSIAFIVNAENMADDTETVLIDVDKCRQNVREVNLLAAKEVGVFDCWQLQLIEENLSA